MKELRTGFQEEITDDEKVAFLRGRLDYEEILEALGIETSHFLGDWLMCHCPNTVNHTNGDTKPSFGFNVEEMRWNCFVCGGGSLLKLVADELDISKEDALDWLKNQSTFEPSTSEDLKSKILKLIHPVEQVDVLPTYPDDAVFKYRFIHPYLLDRGISKEVIIDMNVGFDPTHFGIIFPHWWKGALRGWQVRHLVSKNVSGKDLFYCPICGNDSEHKIWAPKYSNTKGFPKKNTLYGYDQLNKDNKEVIVVESPMSVLYLKSHGFENVVATFGSWSMEQLAFLTVFDSVILWPDNDPAGVTNLKKVLEPLRNLTEVRVVPVVSKPKGDAADVSPNLLSSYLERAISPVKLASLHGKVPTLDDLLTNINS